MSLILKHRNITMKTKLRVLKTYVWSCLLYGCECWTITKISEKKLEAIEMWLLRRLLRIPWTAKRTNNDVLEMANCERELLKTIRKRQLEFLGHICRKGEIEHLTVTGKIEGKRARGRQRITFIDSLNKWSTNKNTSNNNFIQLTTDRTAWKTMIADVCNRCGTC